VDLSIDDRIDPVSGFVQEHCLCRFRIYRAALLDAIAKTAKEGQAATKGLDGTLVTRVAMGADVLALLHQQIQQVLVGLRDARPKLKTKVDVFGAPMMNQAFLPLVSERLAPHPFNLSFRR
jgi:hypothetical protein